MIDEAQSARMVMERCDALAACSSEPGRITRLFATPALRAAGDLVAGWMDAAGMSVRRDNAGNLVGRYEAEGDGAPTLLLGSHLDSVRDAGRYDGPLGVLAALACVERLNAAGRRLPFAIEVLAFADEEGVRYHTGYLGSRVFAGSFDPATLEWPDAEGIRLADAIRAAGGDPAALAGDARTPDNLLGYLEVHIEQGPVLEARGLPVGVVSAIAGQSRFALRFAGQAGHAGTVPMALRRDALCAAAEFVLAAEDLARAEPGLVATVGQITAEPGAGNVIPGVVTLSLDIRHQNDATRQRAIAALRERADALAARRAVALDWRLVGEDNATPCSPELTPLLAEAVEACGWPALSLPSGAGHDGVALSRIAPIAMLFVRCRGGVSHNPAESVETADIAAAIRVVETFLALLARRAA